MPKVKPYGTIYKAEYQPQGKKIYVYVGQTVRGLENRKQIHKASMSRKGYMFFSNALNKYSFDNWEWSVLENCKNKKELDDAEIKWIKHYREQLFHKCLNIANGGNGVGSVSTDTRKKMSESRKGKRHTTDTRKKMSESAKGKHLSAETRKKLSESRKRSGNKPPSRLGKRHTREAKKKLSEAHKGKHLSDEHKKKLSEATKGELNGNYGKRLSKETRQKISESRIGKLNHNYGKHPSAETLKKRSESMKARWKSDEYKKKMSESMKAGWKNKRLQDKTA